MQNVNHYTNLVISIKCMLCYHPKKKNLFHLDFSLFYCIIIIVINNFFEYGKEIQINGRDYQCNG